MKQRRDNIAVASTSLRMPHDPSSNLEAPDLFSFLARHSPARANAKINDVQPIRPIKKAHATNRNQDAKNKKHARTNLKSDRKSNGLGVY